MSDANWKISDMDCSGGTEGAGMKYELLDAANRLDTFDLITHLRRQRMFSLRAFGPGPRTQGVLDHIRKELIEIEADPFDIDEWVDVMLLAFDGAWRAGHRADTIAAAIARKQARNESRTWPDWRTADPGKAIEHVRAPRLYLSGPMSGIPDHNFPAFNAEAARLRALGYDVVNPVDINPDPGATWHDCLRKDLAGLLTCDRLALLDGWQGSAGAHLEMHVAHRIGMPIVIARDLTEAAE